MPPPTPNSEEPVYQARLHRPGPPSPEPGGGGPDGVRKDARLHRLLAAGDRQSQARTHLVHRRHHPGLDLNATRLLK